MSDDILYEADGCNAQGARTYYVSYRPNGSSDPTVTHALGLASNAYVSGSIQKFTFQDTRGWLRLLSFSFGMQTAAGGAGSGFTLEVDTTNTNLDAGIVAVRQINAAGAAADIASDANTMVFFTFVVTREFGDT